MASDGDPPRDLRGNNNIFVAADRGNLGAVRHIVRTVPGAAAATTSVGVTALHAAARLGHAEICRALLAAGAPLEAREEDGLSAKDYGAAVPGETSQQMETHRWYHINISGGKPLAPGDTPLHFAAANGQVEVVKLLLEAKASVTVKNNSGRGPQLGDVMVLLMAFAYMSCYTTSYFPVAVLFVVR